jgi:hypothetical protein
MMSGASFRVSDGAMFVMSEGRGEADEITAAKAEHGEKEGEKQGPVAMTTHNQ